MHNILAAFIEEFLAVVRYFGWLDHGANRRVSVRPGEIGDRGYGAPGGHTGLAGYEHGYSAVDPTPNTHQPGGYEDRKWVVQGTQAARTNALTDRDRLPGHLHRSPGHAQRSPGHGQRSPGNAQRSPGHGHSPGPNRHQRRTSITAAWDAILRQEETIVDYPERYPEDYGDYTAGTCVDTDGYGTYLRAAQSDPDRLGYDDTSAAVDAGGERPVTAARTVQATANGSVKISGNMGCCSKKNILMVMTSICAMSSFAFLCIAVATDYWLHAKELKQTSNGTQFYERTYTGLWRKCSANGTALVHHCDYIRYFEIIDKDGLGPTKSILVSMRRSTIFPLISLIILLIGDIVCFVGNCDQKKKVLTFVAGILFVIGGLCTLIGIILFIGAITGEVGNKPKNTMDEPKFQYSYGSSFILAVGSFIVSELTGVLSVYLYISRHTHAYRKKQERLTMIDANERQPHANRNRRSRSYDRSRDHSRDNSPSHSDTYYTYTPVSDTSKEMSNYTIPREMSRHTVSTSAETHLSKEHSLHSVRDVDTYARRTTPV